MDGIDDVIESMERFADRHWMHDEGQNVREFAQRLRAAKKACTSEATLPFDDLISRMKARCIDEKHSPELWPLIGELEAAVRKERDSRGNQHKMREALLEARRFVWTSAHRTDRDLLVTDDEKRGPYVLSPKDTLAKMDSAIAAPPRVCDVNTLESLSDFVEKTILTSDLLKDAPEIVKRIVMASVRTALSVAYEPAKETRSEDLRTMRE